MIRAFVQARMSSRRFPGKVLAPFRGVPIIRHVVSAVQRGLPDVPVVVATSTEPSDDPLAAYLRTLDVEVFRGPLDRVFDRFRLCLAAHPCDWLLRVCADSPLLDPRVLRAVVAGAGAMPDLVTTTFPRTFPSGHNVELLRADTFTAIDLRELDSQDQEHLTRFYYQHPERFRIVNVDSGDARLADLDLTVDTLDDLARLESWADRPRLERSYAALGAGTR